MADDVYETMVHLRKIAEAARDRRLSPLEVIDIREGLSVLRTTEANEEILECCRFYGFVNKQQGHRDLARELIDAGLESARKLQRTDDEGWLLHDLAEIHHQQGRHNIANELFERSYVLRSASGDKLGALKTKHMSVLTLRAMGKEKWDAAFKRAQEVLAEARELSEYDPAAETWVAHPLEVLSIFARDKKDYTTEHQLLEEAVQIHLAHNEGDRSIMLGQCFGRLGQSSARAGKIVEAEEYYQQSLYHSEQGQNRRVAATTLRYLGDLFVSKRRYDEALEKYSEAMDIAVDGTFVDEQIALSLAFAQLYARRYRFYDAFDELQNIVFLRKAQER